MKIMATSFRRSHACTVTLTAPNPAAGHHQPMPLLETPGHSWASLGQSLVGSLLLSPGSWCTKGKGWASLVAQPVKNFPAMWKTWVRSLGWEDPLEKGIHFSLENSVDYTVHGVVKRGTQLSDFHFHFLPWYTFFAWLSGNCIFVMFFVSGHSHLLSWF